MSKGRNKNRQQKKPRQGRPSRPARGNVVHIGPRPKMPLAIAAMFLAGVLLLILAKLFSPKPAETPAGPAGGANPPPAAATTNTVTP